MKHDHPILEYREEGADEPAPEAFPAMALSLPGALCWLSYFTVRSAGPLVPQPLLLVLLIQAFWPLFWIAVPTALISLLAYGRYLRRRKPWYVSLNLAINIAGLLFLVLGML